MNRFNLLCFATFLAFALTIALDIGQRQLAHPGKETILFASMWAQGEPLQQASELIFAEFERTYPQYHVEARWDGRTLLPAVRPRLLTGTDIPDILNTDFGSLQILVDEGYVEPLDAFLDQEPHPDHPELKLRQAFLPKILDHCQYEAHPQDGQDSSPAAKGDQAETPRGGTCLLPAGIWAPFIFYNRVHYERLGLKIPRRWSELLDNCQRLKAAGFTPFASDEFAYAGMWPDLLLRRALPEGVLRQTIEGKGPRFDRDPRYRAVFQAIRDLHQPGWYMSGWKGSQWPGAQRRWALGEATHMICGTYLIRETQEYHPDPKRFRLGGFSMPELDPVAWGDQAPQPVGDSGATSVTLAGFAQLKGGRCPEGARKLLSFLLRKSNAALLARIGKEIPAVKDAAFPAELEEIRAEFQASSSFHQDTFYLYAPGWAKFTWSRLYRQFFMGESEADKDFLPVPEFLKELQRRTDEYHANGGESAFK
ncbi:MAG: ABC transporter substrate-binding protein [Chloroflexota bacterium]